MDKLYEIAGYTSKAQGLADIAGNPIYAIAGTYRGKDSYLFKDTILSREFLAKSKDKLLRGLDFLIGLNIPDNVRGIANDVLEQFKIMVEPADWNNRDSFLKLADEYKKIIHC